MLGADARDLVARIVDLEADEPTPRAARQLDVDDLSAGLLGSAALLRCLEAVPEELGVVAIAAQRLVDDGSVEALEDDRRVDRLGEDLEHPHDAVAGEHRVHQPAAHLLA